MGSTEHVEAIKLPSGLRLLGTELFNESKRTFARFGLLQHEVEEHFSQCSTTANVGFLVSITHR